MNIAEKLKNARKAAGMTQSELAEKLEVYQKDISRWERGERTPSLECFAQICKVLKVSADAILDLDGGVADVEE